MYAAQDTIKNVGFTPGHIWISEEYPIEGKVTRIYSVLFNGSEYDMSGKIEFFDNIRKLAELEGEGTVDKKISLVQELLTNASSKEIRFIVEQY